MSSSKELDPPEPNIILQHFIQGDDQVILPCLLFTHTEQIQLIIHHYQMTNLNENEDDMIA